MSNRLAWLDVKIRSCTSAHSDSAEVKHPASMQKERCHHDRWRLHNHLMNRATLLDCRTDPMVRCGSVRARHRQSHQWSADVRPKVQTRG